MKSYESRRFFDQLEKGKEEFLLEIQQDLSSKGLKLPSKNIEKLYTIATQLFMRLWRTDSNRGDHYQQSKQGITYLELLRVYRGISKDFPAGTISLYDAIYDHLVQISISISEQLALKDQKEFEQAITFIEEELHLRFPGSIDDLQGRINSIKTASNKQNAGLKARSKEELKRSTISSLLVPLIRDNIIRSFKADSRF